MCMTCDPGLRFDANVNFGGGGGGGGGGGSRNVQESGRVGWVGEWVGGE